MQRLINDFDDACLSYCTSYLCGLNGTGMGNFEPRRFNFDGTLFSCWIFNAIVRLQVTTVSLKWISPVEQVLVARYLRRLGVHEYWLTFCSVSSVLSLERSNSDESHTEPDESNGSPFLQICPIRNEHRSLVQIREFTKSRNCQPTTKKRFLFFVLYHQINSLSFHWKTWNSKMFASFHAGSFNSLFSKLFSRSYVFD